MCVVLVNWLISVNYNVYYESVITQKRYGSNFRFLHFNSKDQSTKNR